MNKTKVRIKVKKNVRIRNEKAITLIALIVTIIVLLILAGVTIATLTGENGILTQATRAKEESEKAEIIEQIQLDIADKQIENQGSIDEDEFYDILEKYGSVSDDKTTLTTTNRNYKILISDIYGGEVASSLVTTPIEGWEYTLSGTDIILEKYIGTDEKIFIPNTFTIDNVSYNSKLYWTSIGQNIGPFINNATIKEVKFDDNIQIYENKGDGLFYKCSKLEKVYNLPNGYSSYLYTFGECTMLQEVCNIPEGAVSLNRTFYRCSNLKKGPDIPSTVTNMRQTFEQCDSLEGNIKILSENVSDCTDCFLATYNNIFIDVKKDSLTYNTLVIENWRNVFFYGEQPIDIVCWGDSLTRGAGGEDTTYPSVLSELCGSLVNVTNMGVGGENTSTIAGRQGGIPYVVQEFTIPADTTPVEINISSKDGSAVAPAKQGTQGLNACYINGIRGNISFNTESNKYYFSRTSLGDETKVENGTEIVTYGMNNYRDSDVIIIWTGQNDGATTSNISKIIEKQKKMIDYAHTDKYIVIGLLYAGDEVNNAMADAYREHFLDLRNYLSTDGNNTVSADYKSDNVHLNADGYEIVGEQVYNKLISLGYITE